MSASLPFGPIRQCAPLAALCLATSACVINVDIRMPGESREVASLHESGAGPLTPVPFEKVKITDPFWSQRIETNRTATIPACLQKCEDTGRIRNFAVCGKLEAGEHEGLLYNDSDVYKVLEGVAYSLSVHPDPALESRADAIIAAIAAAQQPDGYLNTYRTLVEPGNRWTNIRSGHELYCAGHMLEGAIAYYHATGKRAWLDVAIRLADCIDREFGPGKRLDPCGHPELELALIKLARETGDERYLRLAQFFVDQRGTTTGRTPFGEYAQDHKPVREQMEVVGHAVRAMYLYCAMTDIAGATGDPALWNALDHIWRDVVERKMYLTGGIGPSASNEGFTVPYDLPNDTAYCETCASIGMALWNQRLFLATGEAKYADIVERELYNGILAGVSLTGTEFFYDNPLASHGQHARVPWFDCSCCPSNLVRFIPAIGERIYATRGDTLFVSQLISSETTVSLGGADMKVKLESALPWAGMVSVQFELVEPREFEVRVRWPDWSPTEPSIGAGRTGDVETPIDMSEFAPRFVDGFACVRRTWRTGDSIVLWLGMGGDLTMQDERVAATVNRRAVRVGPLVYCFEAVDNGGSARDLVLAREARFEMERREDLLGGVNTLRGHLRRLVEEDGVRKTKPFEATAVPYYAWANRGKGEMVVWLPMRPELAELPGEHDSLVQNGVRVRASQCWHTDTLAALNDGLLPSSSADASLPRLTFWDHRGTSEWVEYELEQPRTFSRCALYWFDDTGGGSCRVPRSWRVLYRRGEQWVPAELAPGASFATARDALCTSELAPFEARAVRVEVELQDGFSAGILEWRLE